MNQIKTSSSKLFNSTLVFQLLLISFFSVFSGNCKSADGIDGSLPLVESAMKNESEAWYYMLAMGLEVNIKNSVPASIQFPGDKSWKAVSFKEDFKHAIETWNNKYQESTDFTDAPTNKAFVLELENIKAYNDKNKLKNLGFYFDATLHLKGVKLGKVSGYWFAALATSKNYKSDYQLALDGLVANIIQRSGRITQSFLKELKAKGKI